MPRLKTVGLVEKVKIRGKNTITTHALFDTGARFTSVDIEIAVKAQLGPVFKSSKIKSASVKGYTKRPVAAASIEIIGKKFKTGVNMQDRSHMNFPVIVGRDIIAGNFLVDAKKNVGLFKRYSEKKI